MLNRDSSSLRSLAVKWGVLTLSLMLLATVGLGAFGNTRAYGVTNPVVDGVYCNGVDLHIIPLKWARIEVLTLKGNNFQKGARVFLKMKGKADTEAKPVDFISTKELKCTFDLRIFSAGAWELYVLNPDKGFYRDLFLNIKNPAPEVIRVSPTGEVTGKRTVDLIITGKYFEKNSQVTLIKGTTSFVSTPPSVSTDKTLLYCRLDLLNRKAGTYDVMVQNADKSKCILPGGFTVLPAAQRAPIAPTVINKILPASAKPVANVSVVITGYKFVKGANATTGVYFVRGSKVIRSVVPVNVSSETSIACSFNLTGSELGSWNLVVTNPNGGSLALVNGFIVTP